MYVTGSDNTSTSTSNILPTIIYDYNCGARVRLLHLVYNKDGLVYEDITNINNKIIITRAT